MRNLSGTRPPLTINRIALIPALLLISVASYAQTSNGKRPVKQTPVDIGTPLPAVEVTTVPVQYKGMNAALLYEALTRRGLSNVAPSEYETKTQFLLRVEHQQELPLNSRVRVGDLITFVVGSAWDGQGSISANDGDPLSFLRGTIETSYNAESQTLSVTTPDVGVSSENNLFGWSYRSRSTGRHVGQNAFGVKKVITDGVSLSYQIALEKARFTWLAPYCEPGALSGLKCMIHIDATAARRHAGNIRVAVSGKLAPPYADEVSGKDTATISNPYETFSVTRTLYLTPQQLVIFNGRTGEVLAQYSDALFQKEYPINLTISEKPIAEHTSCNGFPLSFDYKIDNRAKQYVYALRSPLNLRAKDHVSLSMRACDVARVSVLQDGVPYPLACGSDDRFPANPVACEPITLKK